MPPPGQLLVDLRQTSQNLPGTLAILWPFPNSHLEFKLYCISCMFYGVLRQTERLFLLLLHLKSRVNRG